MRNFRAILKRLVTFAVGATLTGLQSFAGQTTLAWNANTESDIAGYKVYYSPGDSYTTIDVGNVTSAVISDLTAGATYNIYLIAYNTAGLESSPSAPISYTVALAPSINVQPLAQTLSVNSSLNLSVQASGSTPMNFQWYKNGSAVANATSSTFQIAAVQASDAGSYTVSVSNSAGAVTSTPANITVLVPPAITAQPASQTVATGAAVSLSVQATGSTPMQFQWYKDGTAITGATSSGYQVAAAQSTDAGSYTVRVSNPVGAVMSSPATIALLVSPTITTQPSSQTLAVNEALTLSVQASGATPMQYQWFKNGAAIASATAATFQIASVQTSDSGLYTVKVSNSAGNVTSSTATVTILVPPAITTQPLSQTVAANAALSLSVQTSGSTPMQYQWFKNGTAITGATTGTYQVAAAQTGDAGSYTVKVSNTVGDVTSSAATITVLVAPTISTQPTSLTIAVNDPLNLAVQASGSTPMQYQWYKGGTAIAGATSANYRVAFAQAGDAGSYTVKISNSAGSVTSSAAIITVMLPPTILTQPASQTVAVNGPLSLSVQASGSAPIQYQWFKDGTAIPGATSASFQVAAVQTTDAGSYTVKVSNSLDEVTSSAATVTVLASPAITTQPLSQTLAVNDALSLSVQATGGTPMQYQWFKNGTAITGATSASYQVASVGAGDAGSYTVKISNSAGNVTSSAATITVLSPPTITTQPLSQTLAVNDALSLSVQATGGTPMQYQWFKNGTAIAGAISANLQIASVQVADAGMYTVKVSNSVGNVTSSTATVTVLVPPAITTQPLSQTLAVNDNLSLSVQASGSNPIQYQWFKNGTAIAGATSANYQVGSAQVADAGMYTVKVSNSVGNVTSSTATITVLVAPTITTQPTSLTIAAGTPLNLGVQASGSGPMQYQWYKDGAAIAGATSATYRVDSAQTADGGFYAVKVSNSVGSVISSEAIVTVLDLPSITVQPLSQTLAVNDALSLSLQATGGTPMQYQWFRNGTAIAGATSANYQVPSVQTGDAGSYTVKVSNSAGNVTSSPATIAVLVPPSITTQPPLTQTLNVNGSLRLPVQVAGSTPMAFQWYKDGEAIAGATSATYQVPSARATDAGSYTVNVSNSVGTVTSSVAVVTIVVPPSVITQPLSQSVALGATLSLSVETDGSSVQFQWFKNGKAVSGATSSNFQIASVQTADAASYTVKVSNSAGSVTSNPAVITIVVPPSITAQPISQTVAAGGVLNLSVQASGSNPKQFQWFRDSTLIPNATNSSLQIAPVQTTDAGSYTVEISNAAASIASDPAAVVVLFAPTVTAQPLAQTVAPGEPVAFAVEFSGSEPMQVQWLRNGVSIPNATSPVLNLAAAQASDSGAYTVNISNPVGSVTSQAAVLTVLVPPTITTQPFNQTVASGQQTTYSVQANGSGPLLYQWFYNGSAISGATSSSLTFVAGTNDIGRYKVTVANQVATVVSAEVTLTVVEGVKPGKPNNGKKNGNSAAVVALEPQFDGQLSISVGANSAIVLRAVGAPGKIYDIFASDTVPAPDWIPVVSVIASESGLIEYTTLDAATKAAKFYMVEPRR